MVYIQSDEERRLPHNFDAACALFGAKDSGEDIRLTSFDEIASGKFDLLLKKKLFVGSVHFMTEVFNRIGKPVSAMHNPFQNFLYITAGEAKGKIANGETWFIKPLQTKLFTGMVFGPDNLDQLESIDDNTQVQIAPPFENKIAAEVRCYVHNNRIVDARGYAGDYKLWPDWHWANRKLLSLKDMPIAFTMDIGILENGTNVIIELNDMWAIGNYGMENAVYFQLLYDRYMEIVSS